MFGIEGRYAHAVYSAASKKKSIDKVESELTEFQVFFMTLLLAAILESKSPYILDSKMVVIINNETPL